MPMPQYSDRAPMMPNPEDSPEYIRVSPFDRVMLGDDEFAICAQIDLATPPGQGAEPTARIVVLDVGFRSTGRGFGPYDIDGSGEKRVFQHPYVLATGTQTEAGLRLQVYEFDADEKITFGRAGSAGRILGLHADDRISREHADITIDSRGDIKVTDLESTNGTSVKGAAEILGRKHTSFSYTVNLDYLVSRAGKGRHLKPKEEAEGWGYGEYAGRPIIARDTPINTGVYPVGGSRGEALVVDDIKYPKELNQVYERVLDRISVANQGRISLSGLRGITRSRGKPSADPAPVQNTLSNVFDTVKSVLAYDIKATDALARDYQKIAINEYIRKGVGVCRTQALLSAYVVERLIQDGKMDGRVSVDRNLAHEVAGGHAWTRYTSPEGVVYIIDPAQHYVGTLKEATRRRDAWDYRRSEDLVRTLFGAQ